LKISISSKTYCPSQVPGVRLTTITWFERCLSQPQRRSYGIKREQIKNIGQQLVKSLDDVDVGVRNSAANVLGRLVLICGEKLIGPYLEMLDPVRQKKVRESIPTEQSITNAAPPPNTLSSSASTNSSSKKSSKNATSAIPATDSNNNETSQSSNPTSNLVFTFQNNPSRRPSQPTLPKDKSKQNEDSTDGSMTIPELDSYVAEKRIEDLVPSTILELLKHSKWMERCEGLQQLQSFVASQFQLTPPITCEGKINFC
jgi:hypothetical protein